MSAPPCGEKDYATPGGRPPFFGDSLELPGHRQSRAAHSSTDVGFKFANYAFETSGVLMGYGLDFGFPTGDHLPAAHGHGEEGEEGGESEADIYEIEPFLNLGFMRGPWELVAFNVFGIPANQEEKDEVGTEWAYYFSALYHASDDVQLLLEYEGETGISGPDAGETTGAISPGLKVRPLRGRSLFLGAATSIPATRTPADCPASVCPLILRMIGCMRCAADQGPAMVMLPFRSAHQLTRGPHPNGAG